MLARKNLVKSSKFMEISSAPAKWSGAKGKRDCLVLSATGAWQADSKGRRRNSTCRKASWTLSHAQNAQGVWRESPGLGPAGLSAGRSLHGAQTRPGTRRDQGGGDEPTRCPASPRAILWRMLCIRKCWEVPAHGHTSRPRCFQYGTAG